MPPLRLRQHSFSAPYERDERWVSKCPLIVYSRGLESDIQVIDGRVRDVFLDERLRECVSFLYVDDLTDDGQIVKTPIGTGFFILKSLAKEDEVETATSIDNSHDCFASYLITAAHVVKKCVEENWNPLYVRINKKDGTYWDQPTDPVSWTRHDEDDVALIELGDIPNLTKETVSLRALGFPNLATDEYMASIPVTAGYEVFFLGLFAGHPGKGHAQPIIRFGNIALMRHDKIDSYLSNDPDAEAVELDAYLVEARSWGGQSGSPALFYYPPLQPSSSPLWVRFQTPIVLGLVHGQYERDAQQIANKALASAGIAMVIPASKIRQIIMRQDLQDQRAKDLKKAKGVRPEGAPVPKPAVLSAPDFAGQEKGNES